jgi:hypothetical protein
MLKSKESGKNAIGKQSDHKYCIHNTPSIITIIYDIAYIGQQKKTTPSRIANYSTNNSRIGK